MNYCKFLLLTIFSSYLLSPFCSLPQENIKEERKSVEETIILLENNAMERWRAGVKESLGDLQI